VDEIRKEEIMTVQKAKYLGRLTAILSFLFGTIIFASYFFTSFSSILFVGYTFILFASVINIIVFVLIFQIGIKEKGKSIFSICGMMLMNIPILLFYCWITIGLLNTVRINFINNKEITLKEIKITGCEEKTIQEIKAGEEKTVWIKIPSDCTIGIMYNYKGKIQNEIVVGYTTINNGEKINFQISK
jgi:hypothetical protein